MATLKILHNPRCSKSRRTLQLLESRGADVETIEYLKTPPGADELCEVCRKLGVHPTEIIRTRENRFRELGLSLADRRSRSAWCEILSENPILIERPIVIAGGKAAIGRPPEKVLVLL